MYRGGNEDINVFDRRKSKPSNLYGRGFYFTESETHATQYGEAKPYYLNIKNPLMHDEYNISKEQIINLLNAIEEDGEDYDLSGYGYGATPETIADDIFGKSDFDMLQDISATAIGDLVYTTEWFNQINDTNYDGFILPTETVVFKSNQIKNVDNKKPTTNKDIRYSIGLSTDDLNESRKYEREKTSVLKDLQEFGVNAKKVDANYETLYNEAISNVLKTGEIDQELYD